MTTSNCCKFRILDSGDVVIMRNLLVLFGREFEQNDIYTKSQPDDEYLSELLGSETFIAVVAIMGDKVVGGLAAYVLKKFEQKRSEVYIYDLAVSYQHRRQGIATGLINQVRKIAAVRRAYVVFVQADHDNPPAIELYSRFGTRENAVHFNIEPE